MNSKIILSFCIWLCFIMSTSLALAAPPTATTGVASGVSASAATLNATVNANGVAATVTFEYGLDMYYGMTVPADQSPVTGSTDTPVTASLGELSAGTTYYYRVVATNADGTMFGANMFFVTAAVPPVAMTGVATLVTDTSAVLNGFVVANGYDSTVSFEWGTTTAYGSELSSLPPVIVAGNTGAVFANLIGLSSAIVYHYRVKVTYSGGSLVYGQDVTFSSSTPAPTVTTSAATSITPVSAVLNGSVNPNFADTTALFEYGLDVSYGSFASASPGSLSGGSITAVSAFIVPSR